MSDYKPGTVAMVTHVSSGEPPVLAFRDGDKGAVGWALADYRSSSIWLSEDVVTDVRPLVVLDPDDVEQVERLAQAWDDLSEQNFPLGESPMTVRAYRMQAALRSLIKPPKPPEPQGLGAVVEDTEGVLWTRCSRIPGHPWQDADDNHFGTAYEAIDVVRVLSEGVQP